MSFIDHVVEELDTRFANEHEGLVAAQHLVLNNLTESDIDNIPGKFLSSVKCISLPTEIIKTYENVDMQCRLCSATATLCECTAQRFSVLNKILQFFQHLWGVLCVRDLFLLSGD